MIKTIRVILSFLFLISLAYPSSAQTQPWKKLQSPVNVILRYLCFVDSLTGWAAGEAGTIIRTTDGGDSWEIQNSTVQTFITDVFFINNTVGWATTITDTFPFKTVILKTTNGGNSWIAEDFQDSNAFMRTVFFFDSLNGFIGGSYIAYTSDGGNNWTRANVDSSMVSNFPVYKFNFFNRQLGYACGGRIDVAGVVWRTTNYGLSWIAQGISADEIFDIFVFDSLNAVTLSGDPEGLYAIVDIKTTDAGVTWNYEELPFFGLSFNTDFRTYNEGWSTSGYKFLLTTDRGETWQEFETPDSAVVYDLQFLDARTGYAVGENGAILKHSLPADSTNNTPEKFELFQNFPNPFNSTTKIKFTIPLVETHHDASLQTILNVYDVLGNEVTTLVDEYKLPGEYVVEFSPESSIKHLASGIYFYQLRLLGPETSSGQVLIQTKKMVYLK